MPRDRNEQSLYSRHFTSHDLLVAIHAPVRNRCEAYRTHRIRRIR